MLTVDPKRAWRLLESGRLTGFPTAANSLCPGTWSAKNQYARMIAATATKYLFLEEAPDKGPQLPLQANALAEKCVATVWGQPETKTSWMPLSLG
jgi:hypothetical protein